VVTIRWRALILTDSRIVRRVAPLLLLFVATSTGTLFASDPCKGYVLQTINIAARSAQQRTVAVHKHTKATLIAWEGWGAAYLAKHGHPFVPPEPKVGTLHPRSQKEQDAMFKFACEVPPIPTLDIPLTGLLVPDEIPPPLPDIPALTAELTAPPELVPPSGIPTPSGGDTDTGSPDFPYVPGFPPGGPVSGTPPGGFSGPTPVIPPIVPTPEPASFVLFGTGIASLWAIRRNVRRSES
jgi:hypothetical protein